jgi:benzoyl-CoA reductase/2-hydroxyglutaryl-CoA dehydratase subunit BcrC/BadD/HgdB
MSRINEITSMLLHISKNPKEQLNKHIADGKKVVGCLPYFCPEELVHAAGMIPMGLWGAEIKTAEAKRYLPAFYCSILQTTLELGIRGSYDGLSAVMIPILCDSLKGMDANWRYGVSNIPVIPVAHAQNRKTPAGVEFTASQYRKIAVRLGELSGRVLSNSDITEAIRVYNERRAAMRRFAEVLRQRSGLFKPSERNAVFKSSYFMDVREHMALVVELTALMEKIPETSFDGSKLVTSGIIADASGLLKILDDCGIAIVDDEVTHESIRFGNDVPVDPGKNRGKMLIRLVRECGANGVLFVQTKFCDPEEFDYVPLRRMLDKEGIRYIQVETDQQTSNFEQARTAIETFCEIIKESRSL